MSAQTRESIPHDGSPISQHTLSILEDRELSVIPAVQFYRQNERASSRFMSEKGIRDTYLTNHWWRREAGQCGDPRMNKLRKALRRPIGMLETYRSAGAHNHLSDFPHMKRCLENKRRAQRVKIDGVEKSMCIMRFCTAHYSSSHMKTASCAYWKHDSTEALKDIRRRARLLQLAFPGSMFVLPTGFDTDTDAVRIYGAGADVIDVWDYVDSKYEGDESADFFRDKLVQMFPKHEYPLATFGEQYRSTFHAEVAEVLASNLAHVRATRLTNRPLELTHEERALFIGRHADWVTHNRVFMVDDTDATEQMLVGLDIGLWYIALNCAKDAIGENEKDWCIPIFVNIPFDEEGEDEMATRVYAAALIEEKLWPRILERQENMLPRLKGELGQRVPSWMLRQLADPNLLHERVQFFCSVSKREDRRFRAFVPEELYYGSK